MSVWSHRRTVLVGGVVAAAVVAAVAWPGFNRTAELGQGSSNQRAQGSGPLPEVPVVDLRLERLQPEQGELPDADRNPFRFRPKPPPPPPPRPAVRPAPAPEVFSAPPPGPPPVPAIPVKYMGITVSRGQRVAYFTDSRGAVFSGKEGDIIEGRYRVMRVGMDSVELAYVDGRGRQTIRMTGQ